MKNKIYAGIGSRETPADMLEVMRNVATKLAKNSAILRSGGADGADSAFEMGCDYGMGKKEIYLPWKNFNNNSSTLFHVCGDALLLAAKFHPAFNRCSDGAKKLHARNMYQVFGKDLNNPVDFSICWHNNSGGTMQAVRVMQHYAIKIYNLNNPADLAIVQNWLNK